MTIDHWDARRTDSSSGVQPEPMVLRIDPGGHAEMAENEPTHYNPS